MPPREFVDATNHPVLISTPPQRIVSLIPSITEILFTLGLADSIIGVTLF